jgi:hypothetical protein
MSHFVPTGGILPSSATSAQVVANGETGNLPLQRQCPVSPVVSMGRRNTFLKFTRRSLKTQSLSWALV